MKLVRLLAMVLGCLLLSSCGAPAVTVEVAATTAPVAQFAGIIAEGTGISVRPVITDAVSCLHDYSLSVRQMETVEESGLLLLSGAGLEDFMADILMEKGSFADCSAGAELLQRKHGDHTHPDPHIWLDPDRACVMAENICKALTEQNPEHKHMFESNTKMLVQRLQELKAWGLDQLEGVCGRQIITFHDGFAYLAEAFGLQILAAVEEEAGSTPSAAELTKIVQLVQEADMECMFSEINGTSAAAKIICAETGVKEYSLDMAMSGDYFAAMEHNILTLKEALE